MKAISKTCRSWIMQPIANYSMHFGITRSLEFFSAIRRVLFWFDWQSASKSARSINDLRTDVLALPLFFSIFTDIGVEGWKQLDCELSLMAFLFLQRRPTES
jgi:hypothetical protein